VPVSDGSPAGGKVVGKRKEIIMDVHVLNFKEYKSGQLKGFFDLQCGIITIAGCMYFTNGEKRWFAFPQKPYEDKDGQRAYQEIIQTTNAIYGHLRAEVMRQIDALNGKPEKNKCPSSKSYQESHRTPEGEDLSQHYSSKDEDIPF
jgi:hypothetical protein